MALMGLALLAACQAKQDDAAQPAGAEQAAALDPAASPSRPTPAASGAGVACAADETPIFACTFADKKRLAVCGTAPGKAEYRFGGEGAPELVLGGGRNAYQMYSGGGESQLAFDNGTTRYIVFSRMVRTGFGEEGNLPAISDGVVVERAGAFAAIRICAEPDGLPVQTGEAERFLAPADDLFTQETERADGAGQ